MKEVHLIWILWMAVFWHTIQASHFRGGIIMLQPADPDSSEKKMEIFFHISWRRSSGEGGYCDANVIETGNLIGSGSMYCQTGCAQYFYVSMAYRCTDFSDTEDWSFGESRVNHTFSDSDDQIILSYSSCCWIAPFHSNWNIVTSLSLRKRNDTGRINSTPRALTAPVIRLQEGCNHTITIPVSDPDNDIVRCRWAKTYSECGGVCDTFHGAILQEDTCTLKYEAVYGTGMRVASLMIEDFALGSNTPLSSVALQFIVDVFYSNELCSSKPEFTSPTIKSGSCIALAPNTNFATQLTATSGGHGATVTEIETVSPAGFRKSAISPTLNPEVFYVNITWEPEDEQNQKVHSFCFTAVNSFGLSSEQSCIQLMVGFFLPSVDHSSLLPQNDDKINPEGVTLEVQFTYLVQRPSMDAMIIFRDHETKSSLYAVNTYDSNEILFLNSQRLLISPNFRFPEKKRIYVEFERGVVVGHEGCNPGIEPITDSGFWTFLIKDITPPQIILMSFPLRSNENVTFEWSLNEEAESLCSLDSNELTNCSSGEFKAFGLQEGSHSFSIYHRDLEYNTANTSHVFYVDLTPPNTSFTSFPEKVSNKNMYTFHFICDELENDCSFYCSFQVFPISDMIYSPCYGSSFTTPLLSDEDQYLLSVYAVDSVENRGNPVSYMWTVDLTPPYISIIDMVIYCSSDNSPNVTGFPTVSDNLDINPTLTFADYDDSCRIIRTWRASDIATNVAFANQTIKKEFDPSVHLVSYVSFSCSSIMEVHEVPATTATAPNPCHRPLTLTHADDPNVHSCPGRFNRTWTLSDTCTEEVITDRQVIELHDVCPISACGRNYSLPHGICSQGSCICNKPWYGTNCDVVIYTPQFQKEEPKFLLEGDNFDFQTVLLQGTEPITWSLLQAPPRSKIDYNIGRIHLYGVRVGNYTFTVKATNHVGSDELTISVVVTSTYSAQLNQISKVKFPTSQPIELDGLVEYGEESPISSLLQGYVPVSVDIHNYLTGITRSVSGYSNQSGHFSFTYYPSPNEYGKYEAWARHPSETQKSSQIGWDILGMRTIHRSLLLEGETVGSFHHLYSNITQLVNDGPDDLHMVQAQPVPAVVSASGIQLNIKFNGDNSVSQFATNRTIKIDVHLETLGALYSTFPVVIYSAEGTQTIVTITINIKEILPILNSSPSHIDNTIVRGKQKVIDIEVKNTGKISATNVSVIVPDLSFFTLSGFGMNNANGYGITLGSQEAASASLLIQVPSDQPLGMFSGNLRIQSDQSVTSVPVKLLITSDTSMDLTIAVEDEYTYFAEGNPLVSDAYVTLTNYRRGIYMTLSTSQFNGSTTFSNITEDRYELYVEAAGHTSKRLIVVTTSDNQVTTVFLQRKAVAVSWSVSPIKINDTYVITVEADFEVNVPMPVVTVTPFDIDIEDYELGFENLIELNITNHGLIRAENVYLELPKTHPFLSFNAITDVPVQLEAKTSVIIPVRVTRRQETRAVPALLVAQWVFYIFNIGYSYVCGNLVNGTTPVILRKRIWLPVIPISPGPIVINPGGGSVDSDGPGDCGLNCGISTFSSTSINLCDKCIAAAIGCVPSPKFSGAGCIPSILGGSLYADKFPTTIQDALNFGLSIWKYKDCILGKQHWPICIIDLAINCLPHLFHRNHKRSNSDIAEGFVESLYPLYLSSLYATEILGDEKWLSLDDENWMSTYLKPVFDDNSDLGQFVSPEETLFVLNSTYPTNVTGEDIMLLLNRFNSSISNWQSGSLEVDENVNIISYSLLQSYRTNISYFNDLAADRGFDSYADAYNFYAQEYASVENWEEEAGVCAIVRIRLEQKATLTREGFLAKLEIENQESMSLKNIQVRIDVRDLTTLEAANEKFAFGNPTFKGSLSGLGNESSLPSESKGVVEWLIIPYSEAAPITSKLYDIGGKLSYTVHGENVEIPLLPTAITVHPDPSLSVQYFWEKNVISDDPFTDEVEESVPFSLGIMIKNRGFGMAYEMKLTSGQPEIIENEKGLLINFKIIGALFGNESMSSSLTVDFGDLHSNETKTARWWMTTSLIGEFKNYKASFENINPLGDPKLSLIDELYIHELIWNVRIPGDKDDGILDFLVSDLPDHQAIPDKLYDSSDMSSVNVTQGNVVEIQKTLQGMSVVLGVKAKATNTGWQFFSYEGLELNDMPIGKSLAFSRTAERSVSAELPNDNAWISVEVLNRNRRRRLNILDYTDIPNEEINYLINICENCLISSTTSAPIETTTTVPFAEYNFDLVNVCTSW